MRHALISARALLHWRAADRFVRGVFCHYVFDDQLGQFERIIRKLQNVGTFVDSDTCVELLAGNRDIDGRYFHLSFDDGFRNVFANAFPILKRLRVPAIAFVPSAFIGAGWEEARHYCVDIARYPLPIEMARWDDLHEALAAGFEIGSHTRTHARFAEISSDEPRLHQEIAGSKEELQSQLGKECKYISWPFGRRHDADARSLEMARRAGYRACFGAFRGSIVPGVTDPFAIPRHHFEPQWPVSHVSYFARGNGE
jgi:peptidoglycan/xylan/chitin deacetylase (PgdA/CDA1 family)